jgi:predicted DNA-binding ribbon-helix-helix protein
MTSLYIYIFMSSKPRNKKSKRKNTSLRLEESVLKKLKIYAVKKDTSVQQIIEDLVVGLLKNKK